MKTLSVKTLVTILVFYAFALSACNEDETIVRNEIKVEKLTAEPGAITIAVGGIRAIQAEVIPLGANQMIYWKSDNPEIAEVANGIIMGISPGNAIVTVMSVEDAAKKAEISVNVVSAPIPVEEISFGVTSPLIVFTHETAQLTPQILPANATNLELLWKNSNPAVATVSETGLITPLSPGTTTLTIYAASNVNISATLTVTVAIYVPVESIELSKSDVDLKIKETYNAVVTILPADASNKNLIWSSSDENVATVVNGVITGVDTGHAVITAVSADNSELKVELDVDVSEAIDPLDVLAAAKGLWEFSDANDIGKASIGADLTPVAASDYITPLDGGKVRVGPTSYFLCNHGIPTSGSGYVTEYTMMFDFAVSTTGKWYVFFQAKPGVNNNASVYIVNDGGFGYNAASSSPFKITTNVWYRLVIVYKGDGINLIYLNGAYIHQFNNGADGTKSLAPEIRLFIDNNGATYQNEMDISTVGIWDRVLSNAEIDALGGAE